MRQGNAKLNVQIARNGCMNTYKRYRFPTDIISYAVWLYYRFNPSHRRCAAPLIEDLLAVIPLL